MLNQSALAPFVGSQGLGISVGQAVLFANNSLFVLAQNFVQCAPSATNFVYVTLSPTIALAVNQSGFPGLNVYPVAIVTTGQHHVKNCVDYRPDLYLAGSSGGGGGGGGSSGIVATITQGGLGGATSGTLLNSPVAGMYQAYLDVIVTSAAGSGTLTVTVSWNNGTTVASMGSAQIDLTQTGETSGLLGNFYSTNGQPITYAASVAGDDGTEIYQLAIRLVYLG